MTTEAALLQAILREPEEDTPRLMYADYLEENGNPERAEFIRLQIEIYGIQQECMCGPCVYMRRAGQHHNGPCAVDKRDDDDVHRCRRGRKRAHELWQEGERLGWFDKRLFNTQYSTLPSQTPNGPYVVWRRGFPHTIAGTRRQLAGELGCSKCRRYVGRGRIPDDETLRNPSWLKCDQCDGKGYEIADEVIELYRTQPICDVRFSDLIPCYYSVNDVYSFLPAGDFPLDETEDAVPSAIWEALDDKKILGQFRGKYVYQLVTGSFDFPTRALATDAARAAFLKFARSYRTTN